MVDSTLDSDQHTNKTSLLVNIGIILIAVGIILLVGLALRHNRVNSYDNEAILTDAIITNKSTQYAGILKQYYIDYNFDYHSDNGSQLSFALKEDNVGKEFYDSIEIGMSIEILYFQEDPNDAEVESLLWRPDIGSILRAAAFLIVGIALIGINQRKKLTKLWKSRFSASPQ